MYDLDNQPLEDPSVVPMKWQEDIFQTKRKFKIGYYESDGFFQVHPACSRAVKEAVTILKKHGHEVVKVIIVDENLS